MGVAVNWAVREGQDLAVWLANEVGFGPSLVMMPTPVPRKIAIMMSSFRRWRHTCPATSTASRTVACSTFKPWSGR